MDWTNLIVQLGISALVLFVVYRIGMTLVTNMRATDSERTLAMAKSDSERTQAIREGFAADVAAHQELVKTMGSLGSQFSRVEGKLDTVLELTPVRGMKRVDLDDRPPAPARKVSSVIVDDELDGEDTPVDRPTSPTQKSKAQQPRAGSIGGFYGPKKPA